MEFYNILLYSLLFSLVFEFASGKTKRTVIIIWCVILTLIGGLRWNTGNDWFQYKGYFYEYNDFTKIFTTQRDGLSKMEPGFVFLNTLFHRIFGEFYWYNLFICAFVHFSRYYIGLKLFPRHPLLFFVVFTLTHITLTPIRAELATSIVVLSSLMIKERKIKPYLLGMVCSISIHMSCITALPAYLFRYIKLKDKYLWVLMFFVMFMGYVFKDELISLVLLTGGDIASRVEVYQDRSSDFLDSRKISLMNYLSPLFFLALFLYVRRKISPKNEQWWNVLIISYIINCSGGFVFTGDSGELARATLVYSFSFPFLYVYSLEYFLCKKTKIKLPIIVFTIVYLIWQIYKWTHGFYFKDAMVPYRTIFDYYI